MSAPTDENEILRRENARLRAELARSDAAAAWLAKECLLLYEAAKKTDPMLAKEAMPI